MRTIHLYGSASRLLIPAIVLGIALCDFARGQLLNQDQVIEVHDLPSLQAQSPHSSAVLLTSLDTVLHDSEVCCGKDSALDDSARAADSKSLKDVAGKLQGRQRLSDGRPIKVTATYLTSDAVNAGTLLSWFQNNHAALMQWNSRVYMVHGRVYQWAASATIDGGGVQTMPVIHKFLLWDTRYSDSRREVVFNRETDDLSKVEGFLFLEVKPE